ncbi:MAG: hypothetical protein ACOYJA_12370 [Christensenellales bacterium]
MDFLERMDRAAAYVEAHLTEDFAYADAADYACELWLPVRR